MGSSIFKADSSSDQQPLLRSDSKCLYGMTIANRLRLLVDQRYISDYDRIIMLADKPSAEAIFVIMRDKSDHDLAVVIRWFTRPYRKSNRPIELPTIKIYPQELII